MVSMVTANSGGGLPTAIKAHEGKKLNKTGGRSAKATRRAVDKACQRTMTRLRTTTGLRTTARLRTTTTVGSTIATAVPAEDVASATGASIGPAAYVSELATASPATRPTANSTVRVAFTIRFSSSKVDATLLKMSG
jgi:hypothetical protein